MRRALLLVALMLTGCAEQSVATPIGERKYRIVSPEIPGGAEGPNRRLANQLCPGGFLRLSDESHKGGEDRATDEQRMTTIWTIKCI
ncbi:MAG: hypothetical protein JO032_17390 [Alphaproteobacteria bacterium]|nr:hypothetical protein [Alphaproteobacteria bacterium]MBV9554559.1 hypothetical protein [Alphaproteobacteria bacterium]